MDRSWRMKRALISLLVMFHLVGLFIWNIPHSRLRVLTVEVYKYYFMPLGMWQAWGMFAPNPPAEVTWAEVVVRDNKGLLHEFDFPRIAGMPVGQAFWKFRYSKHMHNFGEPDTKALKQCGVRYAVRELNLPADSFPVDAELRFRLKPIPEPGELADPLGATTFKTLERYRFPSLKEVMQ